MNNTIENATILNDLRTKKYSGEKKENGITIDRIVKCYNNTNYMLLDSLLWELYGLYYRDYADFVPGIGVTINPIKLDKAIRKSLYYYRREAK